MRKEPEPQAGSKIFIENILSNISNIKTKLNSLNNEIKEFLELVKNNAGNFKEALWEYLKGTHLDSHRRDAEKMIKVLGVLANQRLIRGVEMERMVNNYYWTRLQIYFDLDAIFPYDMLNPDEYLNNYYFF
ncbi:MAG: hypothetical protein BAJALOKI2v1_90053 [Promethearchaeota archaeon]|nr:MAG: hypothetical protein BAJALOKI2v1_90053 [Candidatus Lokiarchaeota archaeon]